MAEVYESKPSSAPSTPSITLRTSPLRATEGRHEFVPREVVDAVLERVGEVRGRKALAGAFCVAPGTGFVGAQGDEEAVLLLRAHPIVNIRWMALVLVMLLVPSLLVDLGAFSLVPGGFVFVGQLLWYLITFAYALESFLHWYYSVFIITNERVVDIDFYNLLFREVSYATLNHIEEPSMTAGGLFGTVFRFGNVRVPTAAEGPTIEGVALPYPEMVVRMISELSEELEKRRERGE